MALKFTPQHLIKYIYKETSTAETIAIAEALQEDWELNETYEELLEGNQELPKAKFNPSTSVLNSILAYSQATAVEAQH